MADLDVFERGVAKGLLRLADDVVGTVDAAAVARRVALEHPRRPTRALVSRRVALPRVAWVLLQVAALLALVAGTLAVGSRLLESREPLPKQQPSLLEGMVAEEVRPGISRVVNDGVRDLSSTDAVEVVAGYDGGIWLIREEGFRRLGSDAFHEWPKGSGPKSHVLQVAPDGTLWVIPTGSVFSTVTGSWVRPDEVLRSTDGEAWSSQPCPGDHCKGVTVAPDGMLWAAWYDGSACERGDAEGCEWWVGYLSPTGWQRLDGSTPADLVFARLIVTDAGDFYGVSCPWDCLLYRHEDGAWREVVYAPLVDVGPDGTVWEHNGLVWPEGSIDDALLARLAGGAWEGWTSADLPEIQDGVGLDGQFKVAPDGSLWFSMWRGPDSVDCDGLVRFDGQALDRFLPGQCVSMDIAADGSVWVVAGDDQARDLFVITPTAVAAPE